MSPKILAFAGSTRKDSFNKKIVAIAAAGARAAGAEVTQIDLSEYPLPLFDEDLEASEGMPDNAQALIDLFLSHNALLISSPEYNSSISAVLKNTIDWVSRPKDGVAPLAPFAGKVAALLAASPGGLGGLRGLVHLRSILGNMQVTVLPDQVAVPQVHNLLGGGQLTDQGQQDKVAALGRKLAEISAKLH